MICSLQIYFPFFFVVCCACVPACVCARVHVGCFNYLHPCFLFSYCFHCIIFNVIAYILV